MAIVGQKERWGTHNHYSWASFAVGPVSVGLGTVHLLPSCPHFCLAFEESWAPERGLHTGCLWAFQTATLCPFQQELQDS